MPKRDLAQCEKDELIRIIEELQVKIGKKTTECQQTRVKLTELRIKLSRIKEIVTHQRNRILQLYRATGSKIELADTMS